MKVHNCECGDIIGINQIKRHKNGRKHKTKMLLKQKMDFWSQDEDDFKKFLKIIIIKDKWCDIMEKINLHFPPTDEDEIKNKWEDIINRRNYYWKQEEHERNTFILIYKIKELSNKYLNWLIN